MNNYLQKFFLNRFVTNNVLKIDFKILSNLLDDISFNNQNFVSLLSASFTNKKLSKNYEKLL